MNWILCKIACRIIYHPYLIPTYNNLFIPYVFETSGVVNDDGDLDMFVAMVSASADVISNPDSVYYQYEVPGDLFNLTIDDSGIENLSFISHFNTKNLVHNADESYAGAGWQHRLFTTKSPDGKQIMITWTDTQDGDLNEYNSSPDIYGWAKYVSNGTINSMSELFVLHPVLYTKDFIISLRLQIRHL